MGEEREVNTPEVKTPSLYPENVYEFVDVCKLCLVLQQPLWSKAKSLRMSQLCYLAAYIVSRSFRGRCVVREKLLHMKIFFIVYKDRHGNTYNRVLHLVLER